MVNCQAYGCNHESKLGNPGHKKSYFEVPNAAKYPEKT